MSKITAYGSLSSPQPDDVLPIVDVDNTAMASSGTTQKVTVANLLAAAASGLAGLAPSGDTSGAADYANISGLVTLSGLAILQGGQFYLGSNSLSFIQKQSLIGAGSAATQIYYAGTGTAINVNLSGTFTGGQYGGTFAGFYLDGYSAGSSAVGFQHGNLQGTTVSDVAIYGFAGKGAYFKNTSGDWSEQLNIRMRLVQCGTYGTNSSGSVVFDTSSFDYSNFDFLFGNTSPPAHGIVLQNSAQLQGAQLRVRGNFYGRASSNASAVIAIDPGNSSGVSYIVNTAFDVAVEGDGSGVGPYLVLMGSANATSQFLGSGVLSFANAGVASQGISNANFLPFAFTGTIGTGLTGSILSYGYTQVLSTSGSATSGGAIVLSPYQKYFAIYDAVGGHYFGMATTMAGFPSGATGWGGFHSGVGILGLTASTGVPVLVAGASGQSGYGTGNISFTVLDNNTVETYNSTLDDGSGNATFAGTVTNEKALYPAVVALSDGATISVNAALGNVFTVTLGGNRTMAAPSNPVDGQVIRFRITQDGTGSRTLTWNSAYDFGSGSAPALTTTTYKTDIVAFEYIATTINGSPLHKWAYLGAAIPQGF